MTIKNKQAWLIEQTEILTALLFAQLEKDIKPLARDYKRVYNNVILSLTELNTDFIDSNGNIINENLYYNKLQEIKQQAGRELTELVYSHNVEINEILEKYQEEIIKTQFDNLDKIGLHTSKLTASQFALLYPYQSYSFIKNLQNTVFYTDKKLNEILTVSIIKGKGFAKVAREIKEVFNTNNFIAQRIARTELSRIYNNTNKLIYQNEGLHKVKWLDSTERAIGKSAVCKHCRENATYNNGIYEINNVPNIPHHPHCRCTLAPVVEFKDGTNNFTN